MTLEELKSFLVDDLEVEIDINIKDGNYFVDSDTSYPINPFLVWGTRMPNDVALVWYPNGMCMLAWTSIPGAVLTNPKITRIVRTYDENHKRVDDPDFKEWVVQRLKKYKVISD